jgi:hypothetical protein
MLAMLMFMLAAFLVAELAHLYAFLHDVAGMRRVAGHQPGRQRTHVGAVPVYLDAFNHHLHIFFLQAHGSTGLTGRDAFYQYMFQVIGSFGFHNG